MVDQYKNEYLTRLDKSLLYGALKHKCKSKDPEILTLVDQGVSFAVQRTKSIIGYMGEYTLHDSDHLFRVLYLMELLLGKKNVSKLSVPELMLFILSAFFHDIGMAPNKIEIETWKSLWNKEEHEIEKEYLESFEKFNHFVKARPEDLKFIKKNIDIGDFVKADTLKGYLITEYIRLTHALRATEIIDKEKIFGENIENKLIYRDKDLTVEFANLCRSHNEDVILLEKLDKKLLCGQDTYACLPLIGIILRLADILDFDGNRTPAILFSHLNIKHPVSLSEWIKHRSIDAWEITPESIILSARCEHPAIEATIREFCDLIDRELSLCGNMLTVLNDYNRSQKRFLEVRVSPRISRDKIEAKKDIYNVPIYIYRDTKFTLSKKQVIDLLMGNKLYSNTEVALRELLQNSLDACLLRQSLETKWANEYHPSIIVKYYSDEDYKILEVIDNGTGMDQHIIDNYYTRIGASFYKSVDFENLKIDTQTSIIPTSRFGIGILSSFMVADILIVDTMRIKGPQKSSDALNLTVEGQDSIFWIRKGERNTVGTTTKLKLRKKENPWETMTASQFIKSVENVLPNPPFEIIIEADKERKVRTQNSFKDIQPSDLINIFWNSNENIRTIEFAFNGDGIVGSCRIAFLDDRGMPVRSLEIKGKNIELEGDLFPLSRLFSVSGNGIIVESKTIGPNVAGKIVSNSSNEFLARSQSKISLHGIELADNLFKESWNTKAGQVRLDWPFPIILIVDINGNRDLDINSARSEILKGLQWDEFETELAFVICAGIEKNVSKPYWEQFRQNLQDITLSSNFKKGLYKVGESEFKQPIIEPIIPIIKEVIESVDYDLPF
jgi:molecular chaperone HtpG